MTELLRWRKWPAASVLAAVVVTLLAPAGIPAHAATPASIGPCVAGWQELPVPDGSLRATPFEVLTHAGKLAWVVGSTDAGVLALRWKDGRLIRKSVGPAGRRGFAGGVAVSSGTVLGVGLTRPKSRQLSPLAGRLVAGKTWKDLKAPAPGSSHTAFSDVLRYPSGKIWAVGSSIKWGRSSNLAMVRNGGRWRRVDPVGSGRESGLLGVTRSPSGTLWSLGWRENASGTPRPIIARRTSTGWKVSAGASLPGGRAYLTDIAFRKGRDGWAVGYRNAPQGAAHEPILMRWNGKRWSRVALPWDDVSSIPQAISVAADGTLWIAGTQLATAAREARGFIAQRADGDWKVHVLDTPPELRSGIQSVAATDSGAVATGSVGSTSIVLRTCDGLGPGSGGRKIDVSALKERRKARDPHAGIAIAGGPTPPGPGASVALAGPVAAKDVVIRDVAEDAGLAETTITYGALAKDFDDDGWTDVLISRHWKERPMLALGGESGFQPAPADDFSAIDRHGCDAADVDKDGRKDVLCVVGRARGTAIHRHDLILAAAYPDAALVRGALGISDPLGRGRSVTFIRLDKDAYPEVFITSQPDREDSMPAPNRFFRNVKGRFVPAPQVGLDNVSGGLCADATDVDGDGDQDLLHCQASADKDRAAGLRIYRNTGGTLVDHSKRLGIKPIGDIDVAMADVDGDGKRDLVQLSNKTLRVSRRAGSGFKKIYQATISSGQAVAVGDVNGDKRADIYIVRAGNTSNRPDRLLLNAGRGRSFTSIKIPQASSGIGEDVVALDYDRNGLTDFVVLNGRGNEAGPVQLLAAFPRG